MCNLSTWLIARSITAQFWLLRFEALKMFRHLLDVKLSATDLPSKKPLFATQILRQILPGTYLPTYLPTSHLLWYKMYVLWSFRMVPIIFWAGPGLTFPTGNWIRTCLRFIWQDWQRHLKGKKGHRWGMMLKNFVVIYTFPWRLVHTRYSNSAATNN